MPHISAERSSQYLEPGCQLDIPAAGRSPRRDGPLLLLPELLPMPSELLPQLILSALPHGLETSDLQVRESRGSESIRIRSVIALQYLLPRRSGRAVSASPHLLVHGLQLLGVGLHQSLQLLTRLSLELRHLKA